MSLLITSFTFISGLIILIAGAELFIGYAAKLGAKLGVSELLIGITLIALGTSIPEIFVSISSIINNAPSIALGNSIGSNISNIGIIYGLSLFWLSTTLISINLRNIFILVLSVLICGWSLYDLNISIQDSVLFIALFILFVLNLLRQPQETNNKNHEQTGSIVKTTFLILISLGLLGVGSELTVRGGIDLATFIGVPETIIGLTMVAIGTSLPELAASISALRRNKGNMVVGNIVGSNILNIVLIFPIIGFGSNSIYEREIFSRDFLIMSIFTGIFILLLVIGRQESNLKRFAYPILGISMFGLMVFYLSLLFSF
tara:strand:- start:223 stop:1170 length:948 start_codon:yes stop_codon:yes gene_type:complete